MAEFFAELKRRYIYRVGGAYIVVAWALAQVLDLLSQTFELPGWIAQPAIILLALGFPVALFAAWMIESKPHQAVASAVRTKPTIVDWTLCGALAVVLLFMGYQQIAPRQAGVDAAKLAARAPATAVSVAVLPFANLSSDPEQEFFSDGMTEEITAALARVPDLRVVGRTSAFQFKGQNQDLRAIGQSLSATHLIEGSVRRAGDRLRITVQLIKSDDGTHVWSQNYDRELTDVFAIQEDIARTVTASLNMSLGLAPGENLVNSRTIDPEAYQQYLRAKALYRTRGPANLRNAATLLDEVVARNPDHAPAWALLSWVHTVLPNQVGIGNMTTAQLRDVVQSSREKAEPAAHKAIQLDPNLPDGYVALGTVETRAGKFAPAEELYAKALALDPNHPEALNMSSQMFSYLGLVDKALFLRRRSLAVEPFDPNSNRDLATLLWLNGEDDAALAILKPIDLPVARRTILNVLAGAGHFEEAAEALLSAPPGNNPADAVKEAVRLLRMAPTVVPPKDPVSLGTLDFVYLFVGAPERVLEQYQRNVEAGWMTNAPTTFLWHSAYTPLRRTERFKAYARDVGFVEYWRAKGWPGLCRPVGVDDFECS
jgi:TolB-like protein/Flp pilus assembly protein TadD